ncbi:MAG: excinuclease ABC subunit UvrB [Planctomycetes bacterium]|jgi:excinuclease ABC subunit B|nr:excinuclease ABC subunit UvrB [Planctomycetota bacterium]
MRFRLHSDMQPAGDQPLAIEQLGGWIEGGAPACTLLGVTGSGKTFTVAKLVERLQRPTLVLAPNKTLAAQLYAEFKSFFPDNAIEYFVSYYDYFQPEAYVPTTDTYIEKDALINEAIERMRNSATRSLMDRRDVLIVASISCIYGLGSPETYRELSVTVQKGQRLDRDVLLRQLTAIQFVRDNHDFQAGRFRVRGDVVEVYPSYEDARAIRIELWGCEIESITAIDPLRGEVLETLDKITIYPTTQYVATGDQLKRACASIETELDERLAELEGRKKLLEAQRLGQRTRHDLEMMRATGICQGIENYSRHLDGRMPGQPPATLLHYFPDDFLLVVDESHVAIPQAGGMYRGDRARKQTLVDFGFRLPSALDNRPLKFDEFESLLRQILFVSATPADYEKQRSEDRITELVVRPTGLCDPPVEIRPARGQVDDVVGEVRIRAQKHERVLITTLTKRSAEELTDYLRDLGIKVRYLHSDIDSLERTALIRDLRLGVFDVLVGINLLREGLDIPEVTLVAVLDADKEGFLRNKTSLIQTCGRAARNSEGRVILYADKRTDSIDGAMAEMDRRRTRQQAHNQQHGITPTTIIKAVRDLMEAPPDEDGEPFATGKKKGKGRGKGKQERSTPAAAPLEPKRAFADHKELLVHTKRLREEMMAAAKNLDFELAARIRDEVYRLEKLDMELL